MDTAEQFFGNAAEQKYVNMLINKVAVWNENSIVLLDPSMILYFTMDKKKVMVYTKDLVYESSNSLEYFEQRLYTRGFFRSHKSYIVNMDYVEKIVPWFNSTFMMHLKGTPEQIPVSRNYIRKLRSLLNI
jgi:DNA-binding LytR/AlgR family response regulator